MSESFAFRASDGGAGVDLSVTRVDNNGWQIAGSITATQPDGSLRTWELSGQSFEQPPLPEPIPDPIPEPEPIPEPIPPPEPGPEPLPA